MNDNLRLLGTCCTALLIVALAFVLYGCNDVSTAPPPDPGPGPLTITTTSLPVGIQGQSYSSVVSGTGGQTPYTWSVSPALPPNLQLDTTTGTITGTPTGTSNVSHTFTLRDSSFPAPVQVQKVLQLQVVPPPPVLTILTTSLPDGTVNVPYSQTLQAAGGTGTLTWSLLNGTLPQGFSLNPSTGVLSGTPTGTTGSTSNFTVRVADTGGQVDDQALSLTINLPPAPNITTTSLPGGTVGVAYSQQVQATGGTGALTWSISAGTLPAGLSISPTSGVISGNPSTPGTSNFTVRATDTFPQFDDQPLSISIGAAPVPPNITTTSLPGGTIGTSYNQTLQRTGGTGAVTWSFSGSLPPGLTLAPATGVISGTPSAPAATYNFTPQVTDSLGLFDTTPPALSITTVNPQAPTITTTSLPGGTVGVAYSQTLQATGGFGSRTWGVISGSLPANLTLNASSGTISGNPTSPGTSNFTVQVTDSLSQSDTQPLSITIAPAPVAPNIATTSLPGGSVGTPYNQTLQVQSGTGTAPFLWTSTGTLPTGLSLSSGGVISGTPTASGTFNFTPQVTDSLSLTDTTPPPLSIVISSSAPNITTTSLPNGTQGGAYSQTLAATGGAGTLVWSISAGSLPTNLSLSPTGVISGTPTGTGTSNFTARVVDGFSQSDTQPLSITIVAAPTPPNITTTTLPGGTVGTPYNQTVIATGGTGALTWSISAGALPPGLTIAPATGVISGTPTTPVGSPFGFTVRATDTLSLFDDQALTITITP